MLDRVNHRYECTKCGNTESLEEFTTISREREVVDKIVVIGEKEREDLSTSPKIRIKCPECNNNEAYTGYQTVGMGVGRIIQSYKCTNCRYTWRSE
jgi:DNA-directed RNA polymerase subunit M/transcription elongation factor TFIIS